MNRRDLLKATPFMATTYFFGKPASTMAQLAEGHKFIMFVNENAAPARVFEKLKLPVEFTIVPIRLSEGQKFEDAIRIYELP